MRSKIFFMLFLLGAMWVTVFSSVCARDLNVPKDYPTINAAVVAASASGDQIIVAGGATYKEGIVVEKNLTFVSKPGRAIIQNVSGNAFEIKKPQVALSLEGFDIANCSGTGILVNPESGTSVTLHLSNTRVINNLGWGVAFPTGEYHSLYATNCAFDGNTSSGINADVPAQVILSKCTANNNKWCGIELSLDFYTKSSPKSRVDLSDVEVKSNGRIGMFLYNSAFALTVKRSSFIENECGIGVVGPVVATNITAKFERTVVSRNKQAGIGMNGLTAIPDLLSVIECNIIDNGGYGIQYSTSIDGNSKQDSVVVENSINLTSSSLSTNGLSGLMVTTAKANGRAIHPTGIVANGCKLIGNQGDGISSVGVIKCVLNNTQVCTNKDRGLFVSIPDDKITTGRLSSEFKFTDCSFNENGDTGFLISSNEGEMRPTIITTENCKFVKNNGDGIDSGCITKCDLKKTMICENKNRGFFVNVVDEKIASKRLSCEYDFEDCSLNKNGVYGFICNQAVDFKARNSSFSGNKESGIYIYPSVSDPSVLSIDNCDINDNTGSGLHLQIKNSGNRHDRQATVEDSIHLTSSSLSMNGMSGLYISSTSMDGGSIQPTVITVEGSKIEKNNSDGIDADHPIKCVFKNTSVNKNRMRGLFVNPNNSATTGWVPCEFSIMNSSFSKNGSEGFACSHTFILDAKKSFFSENKLYGISAFRQNGIGTQKDIANLLLNDCNITSNTADGLFAFGNMNFEVSVIGSDVSRNGRHGISFSPWDEYYLRAKLESCTIDSNTSSGIALQAKSKTVLNALASKFTGNRDSGISFNGTKNGSSKILFQECDITKNSPYGIGIVSDGDCGLTVTRKTNIHENAQSGVNIKGSADLTISDSIITKNGEGVLLDSNPDATINRSSKVQLTSSRITGNKSDGIRIRGNMEYRAEIADSTIESNALHGLEINTTHSQTTDIKIANASLNSNGGIGIAHGAPMVLAWDQKISRNSDRQLRKYLVSLSSLMTIDDTTVTMNAKGDISIIDPEASILVRFPEGLTASTVTKDANLSSVMGTIADDKWFDGLKDAKNTPFTIIEDTSTKTDPLLVLFQSGNIFAQTKLRGQEQLRLEALDYMKTHPDSVVACRLFQSFAGSIFDIADVRDRDALAQIVNASPDSAIADAIWAELFMEAVCWPSNAGMLQQFAEKTSAGPGTLSGLYPKALKDFATNKLISLETLQNTFRMTGERFSKARATSSGESVHLGRISDNAALRQYLMRCEILSNCLKQSIQWGKLGNTEKKMKYLAFATAAQMFFRPAAPDCYFMPEELHILFKNATTKSKEEGLFKIDSIVSKLDDPKASTTTVQSVLNPYFATAQALMEESVQIQSLPGVQARLGDLKSETLQLFLEDFLKIIRKSRTPGSIATASSFLSQSLIIPFTDTEKIAAIDWITSQASSTKSTTITLKSEFHQTMANLYRQYNRPSQEATQLEGLVKVAGKGDMAVTALNRLTDLYLDYWKVPEKAVDAQRRVIAIYPAGEVKGLEARLRVAKIFYEQKEYTKTIFELTQLLDKVPENYSDTSCRTMLGLAYLGASAYDEARDEFAKVINKDRADFREKCLYLTAYSFISEQKYAESLKPFNDLLTLYPNSQYAEKAKGFIANIQKAK